MVAAADGEDDLARSMWLVTLAALLVVAGLVAVARRSIEAALVVAIPLAFAVGWTFLILFLLPIDVDFLTSALGAIVVAVCAGPALLATRNPGPGGVAADGRQAVAFGAVAFAGFLALTVCDIPALRDLGAAGAVTLPLCGLGFALALPATLTWADRRGGLRVPRTRAELAAAGRGLAGSVSAAVRTRCACRGPRGRRRPARGPESRPQGARGRDLAQVGRSRVNEGQDPFFDEDREREAQEARKAARPYSIAVGVVFLAVLLFAGINAVRNSGEAVLGPEQGRRIPLFAAPIATGEGGRGREHRSREGRQRQAPRLGLRHRRLAPRRPEDLRLLRPPAGDGRVVQARGAARAGPSWTPSSEFESGFPASSSSGSTSSTRRTTPARRSSSTGGGSRWRSTGTGR